MVSYLSSLLIIHENVSFSESQMSKIYICRGASLCLGDLHPDMIVYREQHLKSEKKEYYSHIHNYHNE